MKINLDVLEPIEPFEITLGGELKTFDLLKTLFRFRSKLGDKSVPDDPMELRTLLKDVLDLDLDMTQALVVFRVLTIEGEKCIDTLLKNASGTSPASTTTSPESDSENSDN